MFQFGSDDSMCICGYPFVMEIKDDMDSRLIITDCSQLEDGSYYPGKWTHYGVFSNNHIIDVISQQEPVIRKKSKCE